MPHLDIPTCCNSCASTDIQYVNEIELVGSSKRVWPYIWHCLQCGAIVGTHRNTNFPLGYMSNGYVRALRAELHDIVDKFWKRHGVHRDSVYRWLGEQLGIPKIHIGEMTISQLKHSIELSKTASYETFGPSKAIIKRDRDNHTGVYRRTSRRKRNDRRVTKYDDFE